MIPITNKLISRNRPFKKLTTLKAIIVHWTANINKGADAKANANYFNSEQYITLNNGVKKKISASAHYVVDDHQIVQCIPDDEIGYHVGSKNGYKELIYTKIGIPRGDTPNNYTIGIEMCVNKDGDFSITRQNTIELVNLLLKKYNLTTNNVYRHFDITGKDCPKMMLDNEIWQNFLEEINSLNRSSGKFKVNTSELNVRQGAGTNFPIVKKLQNGEIINKIGQDGIWLQIGSNEWIHSNYVIPL